MPSIIICKSEEIRVKSEEGEEEESEE